MSLVNNKLAFTTNAQSYLKSMAGWGMFMAVLGFIGSFMSIGNLRSSFTLNVFFGIFSLVIVVVQFLSALGLCFFSAKIKSALTSSDITNINLAFKGLMSYFLFVLVSMLLSVSMCFVIFMILKV